MQKIVLALLILFHSEFTFAGGFFNPIGFNSQMNMSLLAGDVHGPGNLDGTVTEALFNTPGNTAVDSSGNVYVADKMNNIIRKITPAGVVTTLAGLAGVCGSSDGTGTQAGFCWPNGLTLNSSTGDLYVADSANNTIRKVTSAGVVTTFSGTGSAGGDDGTVKSLASQFSRPFSTAVDSAGNVYVADTDNNLIRKITSAGVVTVLAGSAPFTDGTGAGARFKGPNSTAVDASGNIYVADTDNHLIRKVTSAGVVTTLAGTAGVSGAADGTGNAASFLLPRGLAVDSSGNVYVADTGNNLIRKITSAGVVTTLAGTAGVSGTADGTGTAASFNYPSGVAVNASGNVYVADMGSSLIRKVTPAGVVTTFAGSVTGFANGSGIAASFSSPTGVAADAGGNVYVADYGNNRIRKITSSGVVTTLAGSGVYGATDGTSIAASFANPQGIAVDTSGNFYIADYSSNRIRKITSAGVVSTLAGSGVYGYTDATGATATFGYPTGVAVDASGNVYVADRSNNLIRKITSAGVVTTLAGARNGLDGTGAAATFLGPKGVAVDASGNVYTADQLNQTIRKITSAGVVTTLAGTAGAYGANNGTGAAASFSNPQGVAVDASGNVYVADYSNQLIRKITSAGVVTTLAGSGLQGFANGTGTAASFFQPSGVAVDSSGNVYVADTYNYLIRKITPAGVVSTLAGTLGVWGSADGTGTAASFGIPDGIAVDASGNVYVADSGNSLIRKITPAGVVSTLAGIGSPGALNGTGTAASFYYPSGIAVSSTGANIYVADTANHLIRKMTSAAVVTTFAGTSGVPGFANGSGPAATYNYPTGVSIDSAGNIYVADTNNQLIRKITSAGVTTTLAGKIGLPGSTNATGTAASFSSPMSVAVDSTGANIYVADTNNHLIRKVTSAGVVTTQAGTGGAGAINGAGSSASFNTPMGVAVDTSGNVYVADSASHLIRKIDSTKTVTTLAGSGITGSTNGSGTAASFNSPNGITIDSTGTSIYVSETGNHMIRKVTSAGIVTSLAGTAVVFGSANGKGAAASFYAPWGLVADQTGNVYVADTINETIRKITPAGVVTTLAGSSGNIGSTNGTGTAALFHHPNGVAVDASGNVYVADGYNQLIRKVTAAGAVTTLAGKAGVPGSANATGTAASFNFPTGIAVDASGNVYVADTYNHLIRKITSAGVVTTLAGNAGVSGSADGTGTSAYFNMPQGVVVDSNGNVYVADSNNHRIRKITSAGVVTTLAGSGVGSANGTGTAASFNYPVALTIDNNGNVYVCDKYNNQIRKITPAGLVTTLIGVKSEAGTRLGSLRSGKVRLVEPIGITYVPSKLILIQNNGVVSLPLMK